MASSAVLPPNIRAFIDPSRNGKFKLQLGEDLLKRSEPDTRFWAVKYNHKPNQPQDAARTTSIRNFTSRTSPTLAIRDTDEVFGGEAEYAYKGKQALAEDTYALVHDRTTNVFTLQGLEGSYDFNLEQQRSMAVEGLTRDDANTEAAKALRRYGDATLDTGDGDDKVIEATQQTSQSTPVIVSGTSSQVNGNRGGATPANSDGQSERSLSNSPDPHNPFDYRHYVTGLLDPLTASKNNKDNNYDSDTPHSSYPGTPAQRPASSTHIHRPSTNMSSLASTPAHPSMSSPGMSQAGLLSSLTKPASQASPSASQTSLSNAARPRKRKPQNDALRPIQRNKQARISHVNQSSVKPATSTKPTTELRPHNPSPSVAPKRSRVPSPKPQSRPPKVNATKPAHNPNELIIEGEDEAIPVYTPSLGPNGYASPMRSFRETAESRNASPAHGSTDSQHKPKRSNLSGLGISMHRKRSGTLQTEESVASQASRGNGTDADVETDLELGSPWGNNGLQAEKEVPRLVVDEVATRDGARRDLVDDVDDDDDSDDDVDGFGKAFKDAISHAGDGLENGNGHVGAPDVVEEEEEEESEEE